MREKGVSTECARATARERARERVNRLWRTFCIPDFKLISTDSGITKMAHSVDDNKLGF